MAPRKSASVPKPVEDARNTFKNAGKQISADDLSILDSKQLNSLQTVFRRAMDDKQHENYTGLKDKQQKAEWLAQYILDPTDGIAKGFNTVLAFKQAKTRPSLGG